VRRTGLLPAATLPLLLTAALFAGPLLHKLLLLLAAGKGKGPSMPTPWALTVHAWRDYLVAPAAEEWCFRACMVPLMWLQVRAAAAHAP
jgi:hypothetical protein